MNLALKRIALATLNAATELGVASDATWTRGEVVKGWPAIAAA